MTNVEKLISTLQECVDGDNIIAFGFVADTSENPATAKGFAIGRTDEIAEGFAQLLDEDVLGKIVSKALAMRVKNKINNLTNINNNENGHFSLN